MKTSHDASWRPTHQHSKYKARISDLDNPEVATQGFIAGKNCRNCLLHTTARNGGEECLAEVIRMQWPEPFGDSPYCLHPDIRKFVEMAHFVMEKFDERKSRRVTCAPAGYHA